MSKDFQGDNPVPTPETKTGVGGPYAWYVLVVLVIVYTFNFIDRQIVSILAEDIKADLGVSDAEIGFLYGTAFAVFYAVFGVPLGRLADLWTRRTLIAIGLFFWSGMTALSGTARSFPVLGLYRIGVGIGESSASPAAFSMLGDYFPAKMRATAVAIYSSGVYIGSGVGLLLGGLVVDNWNEAYAATEAPFGLKGWHVAYFVVGIPGILMALWVWTLREPVRGQSEGLIMKPHPHPFREFGKELACVVPPFTIIGLLNQASAHNRSGGRIVLVNLAVAAILAALAAGLTFLIGTGTWIQWVALAIGIYAVASWMQSMAMRDQPTLNMVYQSPTIVCGMIGFAFMAFVTYGVGFWFAPYIIRAHDQSPGEVGMMLGLAAAIGGWFGVTFGGVLSDWLKQRTPRARPYVGFLSIAMTVPIVIFIATSTNVQHVYYMSFAYNFTSSMWIGSAVALATELVLPRMRATATAFYILMVTFIGLALGPFTMGQVSDAFVRSGADPATGIRNGILSALLAYVFGAIFLAIAARYVATEESNRIQRAKAAGEQGLPD